MTIEVKIIACSKSDLMMKLKSLAELSVETSAPAATLDQFSMQEIVDFLQGQGYKIEPSDLVDEATVVIPDKKTRRKKAAEPEKQEADKPAEIEYDDLDVLKKEVIDRCSQLLLDGQREVVMDLKKKFGRTLSDLPSDRFPEIKQEMERLIGQADE